MWKRMETGASGGEMSLADKKINSITTSSSYTFTQDYKNVVVLAETSSSGSENYFRYNGNAIASPIDCGSISGSMGSNSYTFWMFVKNVKSGDTISVTAGSWPCLFLYFD